MSNKDKCMQLLNDVPEYKLGYVLAYLQGLLADETADDAFCEQLYHEYLNDTNPEKHDTIPLQSLADELGISLRAIRLLSRSEHKSSSASSQDHNRSACYGQSANFPKGM